MLNTKEHLDNIYLCLATYIENIRQPHVTQDVQSIHTLLNELQNDLKSFKSSYESRVQNLSYSLDLITEEKSIADKEIIELKDRLSLEASKNTKLLLELSSLKTELLKVEQAKIKYKSRSDPELLEVHSISINTDVTIPSYVSPQSNSILPESEQFGQVITTLQTQWQINFIQFVIDLAKRLSGFQKVTPNRTLVNDLFKEMCMSIEELRRKMDVLFRSLLCDWKQKNSPLSKSCSSSAYRLESNNSQEPDETDTPELCGAKLFCKEASENIQLNETDNEAEQMLIIINHLCQTFEVERSLHQKKLEQMEQTIKLQKDELVKLRLDHETIGKQVLQLRELITRKILPDSIKLE